MLLAMSTYLMAEPATIKVTNDFGRRLFNISYDNPNDVIYFEVDDPGYSGRTWFEMMKQYLTGPYVWGSDTGCALFSSQYKCIPNDSADELDVVGRAPRYAGSEYTSCKFYIRLRSHVSKEDRQIPKGSVCSIAVEYMRDGESSLMDRHCDSAVCREPAASSSPSIHPSPSSGDPNESVSLASLLTPRFAISFVVLLFASSFL